MAAAAESARRHQKRGAVDDEGGHSAIGCLSWSSSKKKTTSNHPVSFHLRLQLGSEFTHENMDSVHFLRLPLYSEKEKPKLEEGKQNKEIDTPGKNLEDSVKAAGTRYEVQILRMKNLHGTTEDTSHNQDPPVMELLIATKERLYIVSSSSDGKAGTTDDNWSYWAKESQSLEIIDSIPLEEVESVRIYQNGEFEKDPSDGKRPGIAKWISDSLHKSFDSLTQCLLQAEKKKGNPISRISEQEEKDLLDGLLTLFPDSTQDTSGGFLKIETKEKGFNAGRWFYFMIKGETFRTSKKKRSTKDGEARFGSNSGNKDANFVAKDELKFVKRELSRLADKRKVSFNREHRFQLLQETLQAAWNSIPFNLCVLLLIVSNFIFTVRQLENTDPSQQPFYERVDLIYTIIFSAGDAIRCSPRPMCRTP
jgi:hypothetical protein